MSISVAVDGANVSISPKGTEVLGTITGTIPAVDQSKVTLLTKKLLTESDIGTWSATYISTYTKGIYVTPGLLTGTGATNITGMATKLYIEGIKVARTNATWDVTVTAVPAVDPNTLNPDPSPPTTVSAQITDSTSSKFMTV
jgi:hypothetical protein